jgi:hypothetical protein
MGIISLRPLEPGTKFADAVTLDAIECVVPEQEIEAILDATDAREQRTRKIPARMTVLLTIAMNLFTEESIEQVLAQMVQGLRFAWLECDYQPPGKGSICEARYRLGPKPVVELFHRVCKPMALPDTPGAFLYGLRLMAVDGTLEDVPDTPENEQAFGRLSGGRGDSAFPQVRGIYLIEVGTHAFCDAVFWSCHRGEEAGALRLLRSVGPGMLLMWDMGFHSYDMVKSTLARGAHFLGRVPAHVILEPVERLVEGSYLAYLYPSPRARRKRKGGILLRVIEYTLDDPNRPGYKQLHRLITSLLDAERYPALELACTYHERWEIEIVIDEVDTHQRVHPGPLRSRKPVGVIQELYGLLLAHYVARSLMHEAALRSGLDPERLSFINSLRIIRRAIPEFQQAAPECLPLLYERLLDDIAREKIPPRRDRSNPRVVKRKMSKFRLKRPEHKSWPQPSMPFADAVVILGQP